MPDSKCFWQSVAGERQEIGSEFAFSGLNDKAARQLPPEQSPVHGLCFQALPGSVVGSGGQSLSYPL